MGSSSAPRRAGHLAVASSASRRPGVGHIAAGLAALGLALAGCGSSGATVADPPDLAASADLAVVVLDPFTLTAFDATRITSDSRGRDGGDGEFQRATAPVDWRSGPFSSVRLVVDLASTCFPFSGWAHDPPPAGQSWPADCDAFDRNFEFTLDEPAAAGAPPAIELVRAITPFGGPLHLDIDITDVANGLPGAHRLQVTIPTYADGSGQISGSNGGWNVTARIVAQPGPAPHRVLAVRPLWNGSTTSGGPGPSATIDVPDGTTSSRLEYRATGHGGGTGDRAACIGPAEEFCSRSHLVSIDGAQLDDLAPWRSDCDTLCTPARDSGRSYCKENPCGAVASVKAPRANWCPGSLTPPFTWDPPALHVPGSHRLAWQVDRIAPGGVWRQSWVYFAFGD